MRCIVCAIAFGLTLGCGKGGTDGKPSEPAKSPDEQVLELMIKYDALSEKEKGGEEGGRIIADLKALKGDLSARSREAIARIEASHNLLQIGHGLDKFIDNFKDKSGMGKDAFKDFARPPDLKDFGKFPDVDPLVEDWTPLPDNGLIVPLILIPVGDARKEKRPEAKAVWHRFAKDMAEDKESQKLLVKLLNATDATLALMDRPPDGKFAPKARRLDFPGVYLGVHLAPGMAGEEDFAGCWVGQVTYVGFEMPPTRKWQAGFGCLRAFVVAANEYLARTKQGYHLHQGLLLDPEHVAADARDPDRRAAYVQGEIDRFLAAYVK